MLAHNGLALITEKLQNQRLDESPQTNCSSSSRLPQVTQECSAKATAQPQSSLAVKGKNVWALSLESERQGRHDFGTPEAKSVLRPLERVQQPSLPAVCRHKKLRHACQYCDSAPGTPTAPPKKKHCRSLSVPPDGPTVLPPPTKDGGGKIWKPIAVIPLSSNTNSPTLQDRERVNSLLPSHTSDSSKWLPKLTSGFKLVPAVPSPPSVDSGHFTTSDLQTPPGSPVPRPASAASDSSFSSLGSAWHDYSPMRTRLRVLENRSLSCEDRISGSSSTHSMPCVHGGMDPSSSRCRSSSSQDGSSSSSTSCSNSSSSGGIPRCHSQPCVLHHRRCGKKRRRDCDRPTLNFNKMTETAYIQSHRRSEPWNTPVGDEQLRVPIHHEFSDLCSRTGFGLNPIASSPLDSELPAMTRHLMDSDLSHAASIALPLTPPDHSSPNFPPRLTGRAPEEDEEEEEEEEEEEGVDHRDCNCHDSRTNDGVGFFPMNDLDLEQIETH